MAAASSSLCHRNQPVCQTWNGNQPSKNGINNYLHSVAANSKLQYRMKTTTEFNWLKDLLCKRPSFNKLEKLAFEEAIYMMGKQAVNKGEYLFKNFSSSETFYVVQKGRFLIYEIRKGMKQYVTTLSDNALLNEYALMDVKTRPFFVISETDGILWCLNRSDYCFVMARASYRKVQNNYKAIQTLPILKSIQDNLKDSLAVMLNPIVFENGQCILAKGSQVEGIYFILKGYAILIISDPQIRRGDNIHIKLYPGDNFGSTKYAPYESSSVSAYASGQVEILFLRTTGFFEEALSLNSVQII